MENSTEGQRKIPEVYDHQPSSSERGRCLIQQAYMDLIPSSHVHTRHTDTSKNKTLQANYQNISKIVIKNKWLFSFNYGQT